MRAKTECDSASHGIIGLHFLMLEHREEHEGQGEHVAGSSDLERWMAFLRMTPGVVLLPPHVHICPLVRTHK